jgi:molecular chaperone DnaK
MQRLILVGGPTLTPYFRQRLDSLGIPLAADVDPLTIVARGAAVFAGTQRLETPASTAAPAAGEVAVVLEYNPVGTDPEPLVGGRVRAPAGVGDLSGYAVEFVNAERRPPWRSGKVGLAPDGTFVTNLWAEKGKANTFTIEVTDAQGRPLKASPDRLTYTIGATIAEAPLPHTIGVALANDGVQILLRKGTPLPARGRGEVRTVVEVRPGGSGELLKIPIVAGENKRATRNQEIGHLTVTAQGLRRPLPLGSTIEITVEIDESRQVKTHAYIPHLDLDVEGVHRLEMRAPDVAVLAQDLQAERRRLEEARAKASSTGDAQAQQVLARIDRERMVHDVDAAVAAASGDRDAGDKAQKRLQDLRAGIDQVEDSLAWPDLVARAEKEIGEEVAILGNADYKATADERARFQQLEAETRRAIDARDAEVLETKIEELDALGFRIMARQPGWWVGLFRHLEELSGTMTDRTQAEAYLQQGRRALAANDVDALRAACGQLFGLLPRAAAASLKGFGSGVQA